MRSAWVIVLIAACGGGGVKDIKDTPRNEAEPTCRMAGAKLTDLLVAMQKTPPPDDAVNAQIEKTAKNCEDNKWSVAARTCFSKIKTLEEADGCTKELTTPQLEALAGKKEGEEAPESAGGGGAPPPSPPPPGGTRGPVPKDGADPCDGGE